MADGWIETQTFIEHLSLRTLPDVKCLRLNVSKTPPPPANNSCRIRDQVLALQDKWRDRIGQKEMRLRTKLHSALQRELPVLQAKAQRLEADCDRRAQQSLQQGARMEDVFTTGSYGNDCIEAGSFRFRNTALRRRTLRCSV